MAVIKHDIRPQPVQKSRQKCLEKADLARDHTMFSKETSFAARHGNALCSLLWTQ